MPLLLIVPAALAANEAAKIDLLFGESLDEAWAVLAIAVSLLGLAIRWLTVGFAPAGTSGRNTRAQRADQLNTTGLYSLVRHPLYLGNFLALMGVVLVTKVWWLVALGCLTYWVYIERIIAIEEAYLASRFGPAYEAWATRTPTFLPRLRGWSPPPMAFSPRTVLRREYNGILAVAAAFFVVEFVLDIFVEGERLGEWASNDRIVVVFFLFALIQFVVLRTLKKRTRLLHVDRRSASG